ncbi:hypothetical protein [Pseudooceanicola nitratireducens]|uniref:hypothetical protein n=2 Tax=Pseudooceanicola nitratireducens TaxID=517719 RepID=UPI001113804D|nr:hypothetical protein [Pseudooceanicola nitratireducens]
MEMSFMRSNSDKSRIDFALTLSTAAIILNVVVLFVVLLRWNLMGTDPNLDPVAVSLTVLEIFLAVIALGGFWLFRGIVKEHAEEIAKAVAREVSETEAADTAYVVALRVAEATISAKMGIDESATQAQVDAFSEDDE